MPFPNPPNRSYQQLKKILKQTFAIHLFIWHCVWPGLGIKRTVWKRLFLMQVGVESWVLPNPYMCLFLLLNTVYPERQPVWHSCQASGPAPCECVWPIFKAVRIDQPSATITLHTVTFIFSSVVDLSALQLIHKTSSFYLFVTFFTFDGILTVSLWLISGVTSGSLRSDFLLNKHVVWCPVGLPWWFRG